MTRAERLAMQAADLTERLCETVALQAAAMEAIRDWGFALCQCPDRTTQGDHRFGCPFRAADLAEAALVDRADVIAAAREFLAAREETTNGD